MWGATVWFLRTGVCLDNIRLDWAKLDLIKPKLALCWRYLSLTPSTLEDFIRLALLRAAAYKCFLWPLDSPKLEVDDVRTWIYHQAAPPKIKSHISCKKEENTHLNLLTDKCVSLFWGRRAQRNSKEAGTPSAIAFTLKRGITRKGDAEGHMSSFDLWDSSVLSFLLSPMQLRDVELQKRAKFLVYTAVADLDKSNLILNKTPLQLRQEFK